MDMFYFFKQLGFTQISRAFMYTDLGNGEVSVQEGAIYRKHPKCTVFVSDDWDVTHDFYMDDHRCAARPRAIYRNRLWMLINDKEIAAKIFATKRKTLNQNYAITCDEDDGSEKHTYVIMATDTATYTIKAKDREMAIELAQDYFSERTPVCTVMVDDQSDYEVEI